MPGGRLTQEDRQRIAMWLADGLGYAEIGRQLGRPTSTISREVARNGKLGDYRPARAQRAADHRARRRRPVRPAGPAQPTEAVRAFVDEFATVLAATGWAKMTARVFTCLLTADDNGRTAAELVHRLQVSPASVSKSISALEAMDLVARQTDPGTRRDRYVIGDDVWLRAWQTDTGAHGAVAAAARRGVEIFGTGTPAGARLDRMGQFFTTLSARMRGSTPIGPVANDALTVLAAIVYARRLLSVDQLTAVLDWPPDRVTAALATARADRLSRAQQQAIARESNGAP